MLEFLEKLCVAARFESGDPRAVLLAGRALGPNAFEALLAPPLNLNEYYAVRVIHASHHHPALEELFIIMQAYAERAENLKATRMLKFLERCGARSENHAQAAALCGACVFPSQHADLIALACDCTPELATINIFAQLSLN